MIQPAYTTRVCPACGSERAATRHRAGEWRVVACEDCGFVYLPVAAAPEYFAQGAGAWETSLKETHARRLKEAPVAARLSMATRFRTKLAKKTPVDYIAAHLPATGGGELRVLDIGCGAGAYLASLDARFVPFGIELSEGLAQRAQALFAARGGYVVNATTVAALPRFAPGGIDAVVMRSYLEHEPEPAAVLAGAYGVLREGGIVVVKVPNYASLNRIVMRERWCGFRFPEHVNYFTRASLAKMAAKSGFTCRQGFFDALPTSDNMWAVLRK